ncbi:hydroxymethylglutaryl-CoA reductase, degradative [Enterococcus sp. CSURQ0835]|uniref:hydroxymethylglutaryl-CoA reductase, degradative n=1 Tax=Enterococcus sp. CSURQ0835 TaxID=2681394 RepID=UPI00135BCE84|nr:hydroxymethylglutaryl-CoA reductase, degradative [Enterococcus sp. CSURQ0835]
MEEVVILSAVRTPIGKYKGKLASFSAVTLGQLVVEESLRRAQINGRDVGQVLFGNVLQAGNGQNVARQVALNAGLPVETPATTINEVCGSGMKALIYGMQQIQLGQAEVVVAGGTESMSQAGNVSKFDYEKQAWQAPFSSMLYDGLTDAFSQQHMGLTAEKVAETFQVSRQVQDEFAYTSQKKAAAAAADGKFDAEIVPVLLPDGSWFAQDESIRPETTVEKISTLQPVFKADGTVTAANASTLNDGASALVLAAKSYALAHELPYLATISGYSEVGIDPSIMGVAPITAIEKLLATQQKTTAEIDLFQINEAFASASVVVQDRLQLPAEKVNLYGGAIALGHPIGATGARIVTTLLSELQQLDKQTGIASLCIGGGLGLALLITRPETKTNAQKFYQLTTAERLAHLVAEKKITAAEAAKLDQTSLSDTVATHLIENKISEAEIPLGLAQNFVVNGKEYVIPMATEEPSVIAAASNGARFFAGGLKAASNDRQMIGQIVLQAVKDQAKVSATLKEHEAEIFAAAKAAYPSIVARGGGLTALRFREFPANFLSLDLLVDVKDAMGANILNTILEGVAEKIRGWLPEQTILFSILSNYATETTVTAQGKIPLSKLHPKPEKAQLIAEKIVAASHFAQLDPYRAVTHNKGIMNGIDAVVLATGNDTRQVAAGCHAYAARDGRYRGLAQWEIQKDQLVGEMEIPLAIACVGGATKILPKAQLSLKLLAVTSAAELAEVIAAVGLAQNFAALKALVTEGIQKGHMSLQSRSLAMSAGATGAEIELISEQLKQAPQMNLTIAENLLYQLRQKNSRLK